MKFTLGFSPCPNDTFIFDALVNKKINTGGIAFDVKLEDVQTLNEWALEGKLDITKLSYGVLPMVLSQYTLLNSGSALGKGCGPLLISLPADKDTDVTKMPIAVPGQNTTAHLLFSLAYPQAAHKIFLRYDEIENFVLQGKGMGVIIHENRFTYEQKGLNKIIDLGDYWEKETKSAIPLGGIALKKEIDITIALQIQKLIRQSVEYAFTHHYHQLTDYVKNHSQEMSEGVMRKHIDLYVNDYTKNLGDGGKAAVLKLLEVYSKINNKTVQDVPVFLC